MTVKMACRVVAKPLLFIMRERTLLCRSCYQKELCIGIIKCSYQPSQELTTT